MPRVLALVAKRPGFSPGQRFRLEQWAPWLDRDHEIHLDFSAFESPELSDILYERGHLAWKAALVLRDFWRRRTVLAAARRYDAAVIYCGVSLIGPAIYERGLALAGVPMIYDFDDAIWASPANGVNGVFSRLKFRGKTATICTLARHVVVGNRYLAGWARAYNPNVTIVPTSIDLDRFTPLPQPAGDDPFVIGWTGSHTTIPHLELARAPIERLATTRRVVLRVICDAEPAPFAGVKLEFVPWTAAREAADLAPIHVGIMPMPDEEFARGKCGCKALQYMAVERPAVVSPVGVNTEIIRHGDNGLLASSADEWYEALSGLAGSAELRAALGARGRRTVEDGYSARTAAAAFARVVRQVIAAPRPGRARTP